MLVDQIMNEIYSRVEDTSQNVIVGPKTTCVLCTSMARLAVDWLPCGTLHHQSIAVVCSAKNGIGYGYMDLEKKWTQ